MVSSKIIVLDINCVHDHFDMCVGFNFVARRCALDFERFRIKQFRGADPQRQIQDEFTTRYITRARIII